MMKKFAIIENGTIVNIGVADDEWPFKHQTVIEISDDTPVGIGWSVVKGKIVIPYEILTAHLKTEVISETETKYIFEPGHELPMHNHVLGGKHTTEILEGEFKIIRNGKESVAKVGDKLKFTKTEDHSITAITAGSIINKTY